MSDTPLPLSHAELIESVRTGNAELLSACEAALELLGRWSYDQHPVAQQLRVAIGKAKGAA